MAKKNNSTVESTDTSVEVNLIFDGLNWVESLDSTFDFDNNTFDGTNWIPKEA